MRTVLPDPLYSTMWSHMLQFFALRLKGAGDETASGLQAASGLFYILANHVDVLVRTLSKFILLGTHVI